MLFYTKISTILMNIIKSNISFCRHRFYLFLRLFIFILIFIFSLYLSSVYYYSYYCSNRFQDGLNEANKRHLWNVKHGVRDEFMPILIPVCDRPHYLKRVLDGLIKVDGINETILIISQDCEQSSITSLLQSIPSYIRTLILPHIPPYFSLPNYVYTREYATSANIKFLLEFAFEHMLANGAILLESDLIPSVDFYRYHQWTYQTLLNITNSTILTIHSFNIDSRSFSDPYELFHRRFDSWGWSTARTRWNWLKFQWTKFKNWDITLSRSAMHDRWKCMIPKLSRTRMIGLKGINVNVKTENVRKRFEEDMYMSEKKIDYNGKKPKITYS